MRERLNRSLLLGSTARAALPIGAGPGLGWLGSTMEGGGNTEVAGFIGVPCGSGDDVGLAIAHYSSKSQTSHVMVAEQYASSRRPADGVGHFLIKVPEPDRGWMLVLGSLALALLARRRAQ